MTIEEHKEFPVESASLKEVRTFAREVLAKDPIFQSTSDDVVLKNLQIFYFVKDDTNDNSQDINNSCKNIKCTDDGIIISGSLTVS